MRLRAASPPALAGLLVAAALAACTFDFDAGDYTYPGEAPTACRTDADCASRAPVPCGVWVCGAGNRCEQQPAEDGGACSDGDPCTSGTRCEAGVCGGGSPTCDDGHACTTDTCDPSTGACAHAPDDGLCSGGGPCLTPHCDAARGCILLPQPEGDPCDDGDACTEGDTCRQGGRCTGAPRDCDPGEPCRVGTCDPETGCGSEEAPDDTPCVPADPCAERGRCEGGACVGVGSTCDCRTDADCAPFQPEDRCIGTYVCEGSACVIDPETVPQCPELPPGGCLESLCNPETGECVEVPLDEGTPCEDGDRCTTDDACDAAGTCRSRKACDDGDPCTEDTCDAATGACGHVQRPLGASCDDADPQTSGDACVGGRCVGWSTLAWRDRDRATWFDGVTFSEDAFYAIGRSRSGEADAVEAFVARLPADGNPGVAAGSVRTDAVWARVNGGVAVGSGGAVAVHENGGWARATALEGALAALPVAADDLRGVWPVSYAVPGSATLRAIWFAGRGGATDPPPPWLARCAGPEGGAATCLWLGGEPAFRGDIGLDAVAAFVAAQDPCPESAAPLCLDPARSMAFAAGSPSAAEDPGPGAPTLYRGRPSGNGEAWQDARTLDGLSGAFRDLHGSGTDDVWGVGGGGLLVRWNGAGWVPGAAAVSGWDLNGVWASGSVALIAASRQLREGGDESELVLRFALFVGTPSGATYEWRRVDLLRAVLCPGGSPCPADQTGSGALTDVWAVPGATAGAPLATVVAVGHRTPTDGGLPEALVFRLDLE